MTWQLYQGDHLEIIPKHIEDESIDLTVTSPPYDNLRDYTGYKFDYERLAKELYRVTKPGGVVVWVVGDTTKDFCESLTSFTQAKCFVEQCGFKLLDTMIYGKENYAPAYPNLMRYSNQFEYMFVFLKGRKPKTFNPITIAKSDSTIERRKYSQIGAYRQRDGSFKRNLIQCKDEANKQAANVWFYPVSYGNSTTDKIAFNHPAIFPEKLAHDHIVSWSNPGDIVLDPMAGSGTVLKVAEQLGRESIGIEISEEYCDIIKKRMANFQMTIFNL